MRHIHPPDKGKAALGSWVAPTSPHVGFRPAPVPSWPAPPGWPGCGWWKCGTSAYALGPGHRPVVPVTASASIESSEAIVVVEAPPGGRAVSFGVRCPIPIVAACAILGAGEHRAVDGWRHLRLVHQCGQLAHRGQPPGGSSYGQGFAIGVGLIPADQSGRIAGSPRTQRTRAGPVAAEALLTMPSPKLNAQAQVPPSVAGAPPSSVAGTPPSPAEATPQGLPAPFCEMVRIQFEPVL